ncbi:DUF5681 domain-containing protein [Tepidamorphus sp. 3E244]|uniref:DUF5681 domain-containing protein n=1 Tax=Tepidamorphus sp. 3E244 TaxID=3385498 RepID=UPI0038FCCC2F
MSSRGSGRAPNGDTDAVGYGKPPKHAQFRKGQSGNPKGRPRKRRTPLEPLANSLQEAILREASRIVGERVDGEWQYRTVTQSVVRAVADAAAQGDGKSQKLFLEMVASAEAVQQQSKQAMFEEAVKYKQEWEAEIRRRERAGIKLPNIDPHPDDIELDYLNGRVSIKGQAMN